MTGNAELWAAYRAAVVEIDLPGGTILVGPRGVLPERSIDHPGGTIHIITADDPGGVVTPPATNRAAERAMATELSILGATSYPARGRDLEARHIERGFAVAGLTDDAALALGRQFGQLAIYRWTPQSWDLIDCATGEVTASDWGGTTFG